jgi:hypothetical protein
MNMSSEIDIFWKFVDEVCEKYDVVKDISVYYPDNTIPYIGICFDITISLIYYWDKIVDEITMYKLLLGIEAELYLVN